MSDIKSTIPLQLRWIAIILGVVFLFWIPFEDSSTLLPLFFAVALSAWMAVIFLFGRKKVFRTVLPNYILAGSIAGLVITPLTLLLMALKTGLHGHQASDFTNQQILSVIYRTPFWLVGGFLIGLGSALWFIYRKR